MGSASSTPTPSPRRLVIMLLTPASVAVCFGSVSALSRLLGSETLLFPSPTFGEAMIATLTVALFVPGYHLLAATLLWADARTVRRREREWQPRGWLYAVLGALGGWFAVVYYLRQREPNVDHPDSRDWWALLFICVVVLGVSLWPLLFGPRIRPNAGLVVELAIYVGIVAGGLLSIGLYYDSRHVRRHTTWKPDPVTTCAVATLALGLPFAPLLNVFPPSLLGASIRSYEALASVPLFTLAYGSYYLVRRSISEWSNPG